MGISKEISAKKTFRRGLNNDNRERGIRLKDGSESGWNFSDWWQNTFVPKAEEVVKADFTGAAAGAVMGAIVGATGESIVAPGPGTVTVAVTGAIVGGAQGALGSSAIAGHRCLSYFMGLKQLFQRQ